MIATRLSEVAPGGDAELDAEVLEQDGHEIRNHDNHQQRVAESCAAGEIGRPIARIHVADRDKEAGTGKCEQLSPERSGHRNDDAAMDFRQRNVCGLSAPGSLACGQFRHFLSFLKIYSRPRKKALRWMGWQRLFH